MEFCLHGNGAERLVRLIDAHGEDEFRRVCGKLDVQKFTAADVAFLQDYVAIMKPVAQALNILQAEDKMYMACLLPTISILKEKLHSKQASGDLWCILSPFFSSHFLSCLSIFLFFYI